MKHIIIKNNQKNLSQIQFYEWFAGFTDAEGCFLARIQNQRYLVLSFQIILHVDDIETLYFIKDRLKIGSVYTRKNECVFTITNYKDITNSLVPIFEKSPLLTTKSQSLETFSKISEMIRSWNTTRIPESVRDQVLELKSSINNKFVDVTKVEVVSDYWLIGFIEGEGTFYINQWHVLRFEIGQLNRSKGVLEAIQRFFISLKASEKSVILNVKIETNEKKNTSSLKCFGGIQAFDLILRPWIEKIPWVSRKALDIELWIALIDVLKVQYHTQASGRKLVSLLAAHMNKNRYSTSINFNQLDYTALEKEIKHFYSEETFVSDTSTPDIKRRTLACFVHDNQTNQVESFSSLFAAAKHYNLGRTIVQAYRDTGKRVQNRFLIYTK